MNNQMKIIVGFLVFAVFISSFTLFTVNEYEKAIKFKLGKIEKFDYTPGLYVQIPFVNNIRKFDARILTLDSEPQQFLTGEKKNVIVDFFVKWRIARVDDFYTSFSGDERQASLRLSEIIKNGLQIEFDTRTIKEVVSGDRAEIMDNLKKKANEQVGQFGIDIIDVRIKQIELPPKVRSSVFQRMRAERERVAKSHRSKGAETAERIRADADRQRTVIKAEAYREAETIRGNGDAKATDIYAKAYGKNSEFYSFYRSINAYKESFSNKKDIIVLEPTSEFFKYFKNKKIK